MKTTKDIAEMFSLEIERISRGEVRLEVIGGLERCSNAMIKLARLEMEYAWRDWGASPPSVPWVASSGGGVMGLPDIADGKRVRASSDGIAQRVGDLEQQIKGAQKELDNHPTETMRGILKDKIRKWQDKIDFLIATQTKVK